MYDLILFYYYILGLNIKSCIILDKRVYTHYILILYTIIILLQKFCIELIQTVYEYVWYLNLELHAKSSSRLDGRNGKSVTLWFTIHKKKKL